MDHNFPGKQIESRAQFVHSKGDLRVSTKDSSESQLYYIVGNLRYQIFSFVAFCGFLSSHKRNNKDRKMKKISKYAFSPIHVVWGA